MKRVLILLSLILLAFPLASAINLEVNKISSSEVLITELGGPVVFNLEITNLGFDENLEFYNLLGFEMFPVGTVHINSGQTKEVELKISPIGEFPHRGSYTFQYYIRGNDDSEIKKELTFRIIDLKDAFEISAGEINPDSNTITVNIHNKVNFEFEEINAKLFSAFFNLEETFSLEPNKKKEFEIQLDKEDFKKLLAGFYTLNTEIEVKGKKTEIETTIKFAEKDYLTTKEKNYGFIISTQIIEKINEGNVIKESSTTVKKNILSRFFTDLNPEPDLVERQGTAIYYTWNREVKPGETLEIIVKTNWFIPLLVIFFIVTIVILAKQYSKTNIVMKKKVSFVRSKGGEFALKVSVLVNARKYIENVRIRDRLPPLVKIHERFGGEQPKRINTKTRVIEWDFEKLEAGETRVLSYIIYSKIGVVGKFALPSATAIYEREGDISESESNRAFFIAEQDDKEKNDY